MNPYLLRSLSYGPIIVGRLIKTIPSQEHDLIIEEGRFSPREVVAHLADWEPVMRGRIQLAVTSPGSTCETWDEGQRAIDNAYHESDVFEQLQKWQAERQKTTEYVGSLTAEDFARTLVHPERGVETAYDTANMMVSHDSYHLEQLSAYLVERVVPTW